MSRCILLTFALGLLTFASGCCGGPCGRGVAFNNSYSPAYPTAYAPNYSTAYGMPAQAACSSCGTGY